MNESIDNLRRVSAEPRRAGADQRRDEQLRGRHRQRRRRGHQQRHQVGLEPLPGQRIRVLPQQQDGRELLGQQPVGCGQAGAQAGHLRRHARRAARQEQGVLLRQLPGHAVRRAGFETRLVAPASWRRGDLSAGTTAIRDPVTEVPFAGNQIPAEPDQPDRRARSWRTRRSIRCRTVHRAGRRHRQLRRRDAHARSSAHQGDVRVDWNASAKDKMFGRFSFAEYEDQRPTSGRFRCCWAASGAPFRNVAFNWNRVFNSSLVNEVLVGYNQIAIVNRHARLGRDRRRATRRSASPAVSPLPASARSAWAAG